MKFSGFGLVWLGYINYCRLFSASSMFIHIEGPFLNNSYVHSLNVKTVLFQAIQFSISTKFNSVWPIDRYYHSGPEWTWERLQWRGTSHSPKLQHYWNLTIRMFSVNQDIRWGNFTDLHWCSRCILQPQSTGPTWLEFELAYFGAVVQHFSHYVTITPPEKERGRERIFIA